MRRRGSASFLRISCDCVRRPWVGNLSRWNAWSIRRGASVSADSESPGRASAVRRGPGGLDSRPSLPASRRPPPGARPSRGRPWRSADSAAPSGVSSPRGSAAGSSRAPGFASGELVGQGGRDANRSAGHFSVAFRQISSRSCGIAGLSDRGRGARHGRSARAAWPASRRRRTASGL